MTSTEARSGPEERGQFILLHDRDNILVCARPGYAGEVVTIDGQSCCLTDDIQLGHKIARVPLAKGETVFRYGTSIGSMTNAAQPGEHVHNHNLKSDYIAAHNRDAVHIREIRS